MAQTLYEKVFERHAVRRLPSGQYQLFMGLHLIHEVTSPQAFDGLRIVHHHVHLLNDANSFVGQEAEVRVPAAKVGAAVAKCAGVR
jgi:homoaconitase/3-isopropylmalate dehydratase large subunit